MVAGAPGAGKSYVAERLIPLLDPAPALIDKDTLFNPLIDSVLREAGRPLGERESPWFDRVVKPHTYRAMLDVVREVRQGGCDVIVTAPFTEVLYEPGAWEQLCAHIGEGQASLLWVRSDAETLRDRLTKRGLARDGDKLTDFDSYAIRMHVADRPVAPHMEIDNRYNTTSDMAQAIRRAAGLHAC